MTNVEKLKQLIEKYGIGKIHFTKGTNPNMTAEDIAGELIKSIERLVERNKNED